MLRPSTLVFDQLAAVWEKAGFLPVTWYVARGNAAIETKTARVVCFELAIVQERVTCSSRSELVSDEVRALSFELADPGLPAR